MKERLTVAQHAKIVVKENQVPAGMLIDFKNPLTGKNEKRIYDNKMGIYQTFPRMGSFEVYYGSHVVFSKIKTGQLPRVENLISKFDQIAENLAENRCWNHGFIKQNACITKNGRGPALSSSMARVSVKMHRNRHLLNSTFNSNNNSSRGIADDSQKVRAVSTFGFNSKISAHVNNFSNEQGEERKSATCLTTGSAVANFTSTDEGHKTTKSVLTSEQEQIDSNSMPFASRPQSNM